MIIVEKASRTSDKLSKEKVIEIIRGLIKDGKHRDATYIAFGFLTALRIGDILDFRWEHLYYKGSFRPTIHIQEQKTSKTKTISLNKKLIELIELYWNNIGCPTEGYLFCNKNGERLSERAINNMLKDANVSYLGKRRAKNFSSHSLRKSFCYNYYLQSGKTEASLHILQKILNHSNIAMTRIYLGLQQNEIDKAYNVSFDF